MTIVALIAGIYVVLGLIGLAVVIFGRRAGATETPHWKRFDDAHYWDDLAEDWRPHEDAGSQAAAA
ncbi:MULTISPECIES: hypothetical protein [Rhodopseudomonas]|uniref:Uncharacterized protein n=1 Tax=Rhodopseudomonas palustris TaxID=1076 RepID=A0A0D7F623_RHOPL|nr:MULTISPECIES: hypothetical protein [Rhodopseudomonas]KIZ48221.1 hypothetical protein OO17_00060 [Rhodopseudomonas palustris]MDF3811747.1 hypothetical protein [Rhodopseudomonas sp. BAL398]WOK17165.1 hypothetical protein RBJ75_24075 [Rhodopseudomonas sp. BAL398]